MTIRPSLVKFAKYKPVFIYLLLLLLLQGWGNTGHRTINKKSAEGFPATMNFLTGWADSLSAHASDADYRKSDDPNEGPKHYIDIDNYPTFVSSGRIPHDYDSVVAIYGQSFVIDQGTLPWTILVTMDSLTAAFRRNDLHRAMLLASDLGHYVGDGHMPLHLTKNYNGQLTGQSGVHSRYESTMINRYISSIVYNTTSAEYIPDVKEYTFSFIYENYRYVDSVLYADAQAKAISGSTSSNQYYQKLWEYSAGFTNRLFSNASDRLSSLIYTAWKNATTPASAGSLYQPEIFRISEVFPNPFNGMTSFYLHAPSAGEVRVSLYSPAGDLITSFNQTVSAGDRERVVLDFSTLSAVTGVYYLSVTGGGSKSVRKLVYLK